MCGFRSLALVAVLLPISGRIFRWCHYLSFSFFSFFFVLRRPFAKCIASLFLIYGVSSSHFFLLILKFAGLVFLFCFGFLLHRNLVLCLIAFSFPFAKEKDVVLCSFLKIVNYSKCQFLLSSVSYVSRPSGVTGFFRFHAVFLRWPSVFRVGKYWPNSLLKTGRISSRPFLPFFSDIGQLFCE